MDQLLAFAGKIGPPGLLAFVCLLILLGKLTTSKQTDKLIAQFESQIAATMISHKETIAATMAGHKDAIDQLTVAHNLRVLQMTEAHDKAREDHQRQLADVRASYTAQLQNLTDVYGKQVSWTADDRNGWHEAYDDLSREFPVITGALNSLTAAHEKLSDQLLDRETARQRAEHDASH